MQQTILIQQARVLDGYQAIGAQQGRVRGEYQAMYASNEAILADIEGVIEDLAERYRRNQKMRAFVVLNLIAAGAVENVAAARAGMGAVNLGDARDGNQDNNLGYVPMLRCCISLLAWSIDTYVCLSFTWFIYIQWR